MTDVIALVRLLHNAASFLLKHGAPDTVQAIGLRGRPVAFVDAQDQPLFAGSEGRQYI